MSPLDEDAHARALADYRAAAATTQRLIADANEVLRQLAIAITRREEARVALERLQHDIHAFEHELPNQKEQAS